MKIYIVRDKNDKIVGSRNKKVFTSLGHIRNSYAGDVLKEPGSQLIIYDLTNIEPKIVITPKSFKYKNLKDLGLTVEDYLNK